MSRRIQTPLLSEGGELRFAAMVACMFLIALSFGYVTGITDPNGTTLLADMALIGLAVTLIAGLAILVMTLRGQLTVLKKKHHDMLRQSERDALTEVNNREKFVAESKSILQALGKQNNATLLLVDIDHFKQVNDTYGHPAGDEVLIFFAKQLRLHFPNALVGRLGGDEFSVLFEHADPLTAAFAHELCARFVAGLRQGAAIGSKRLPVSASIGIARAPVHGKTWSSLVANADMALYASKKNGRACSTLYKEEMLTDLRNEKALVRELRAAILLKQLSIAYQPIVDGNGRLVAYEALLRWSHVLRGNIPPDVFIPVAERSHLIADIGYYVLRQVCRDMENLPPVRININLSATQIASHDLLDRMLDILQETGTDPRRIVIEITESASLAVNAATAARLKALQDCGFSIALDDFGMGYSEFNQLRALPFDVIKIDKSYICALGADLVTDVFVSAVVEIARRSGKLVVAEGIESEDDRLRATAAGCHAFQGYYFGKPALLKDIDHNYPLAEGLVDDDTAIRDVA